METVSILLTKWKKRNGDDAGSSILKTSGCSLTPAFDHQEWETFKNWDEGQIYFDELLNQYKNNGFKTREELGITTEGNFHDEKVLNIKLQLWNLHLDAYKKTLNIQSIFSDSPDIIE